MKNVLGKKYLNDNKSNSNYPFEEKRQHKTYNEALMKKYLVQKFHAACWTENVGLKKLSKILI